MIHIAICDDEKEFVAHLTSLINRYAAETGEEIKITPYYDGIELVEKYDTTIDLIFLDIQMRLLNGLHTAERVRKLDENVGIIFLTSLVQYGLEGYRYKADNYIIKPIKYIRLKDELNNWIKKHEHDGSPFIVIANDKGKYKILLKELRYIETADRKLLFYTGQEKIACYQTMRRMEIQLSPQNFVRCHSGYLVNMYYIKRVEKLDILLTTGEHIPISQPKRKGFMERLTDYWGDIL